MLTTTCTSQRLAAHLHSALPLVQGAKAIQVATSIGRQSETASVGAQIIGAKRVKSEIKQFSEADRSEGYMLIGVRGIC